jgi:hypothetical protein
MGILLWIIAAIAAMGFIVFFSALTKFIYYSCFVKKRFNYFIQEIKQDPLLRILLKEIYLQNIRLAPFGLFDEFLLRKKAAMTAIPMKINISNKVIKRFLHNRNDKAEKAILTLKLAHELGHLNQLFLKEKLRTKCKYQNNCLYVELQATKEGCRLLEKISGKKITKTFPKNYLNIIIRTSIEQCKKCIGQGILENKCPKIEELKKMGVKIKKNKISLSFDIL